MVSTLSRTIAFCADDVGLTFGVADTVAELAAMGRLAAASCVTTARGWSAEGRALEARMGPDSGCQLGLHFNLTEGVPLSADLAHFWPALPRLERLIVLAHLGRLPRTALAVELRAQRDAFTAALGRPPAYIDGHQHVHGLPIVRDVLMAQLEGELASAPRPAIRNTGRVAGPGHVCKRVLIERTGGRALQSELEARGIRHNTVLLGVYDFADPDYRALVRGWLGAAPACGGLVFCHPNDAATSPSDPIGDARRREAAYLSGPAFADDLGEAGFSVGPAWQSSIAD